MGVKKESDIIGIIVVAFLLSLVLVFAAEYKSQLVFGNLNTTIAEDVTTTINMSVNISGTNITIINVSLYDNNIIFTSGSNRSDNFSVTSAEVNFTNTSNVLFWKNTTFGLINNNTNESMFSFNVTGFSPGKYNLTVLLANGTGSIVNKTNISIFVNDTTAPNISSVVGFGSNTNHSGTINFNFTLRDNQGGNPGDPGGSKDGTGVNIVNFTIYNYSARSDFNESTPTNTTTAGYFNITIDTSQYSDGKYNITIVVNDSNGNLNSTNFTGIIFDNTAPDASFSCSPNPANNGDTVSCTCAPADESGGSGINGSQTSFTDPDTTNNGNQTLTCDFEDLAGNSGSVSLQLEVKSPSGGGSSGGGGGSSYTYRSTISKENKEFKEWGTIEQSLGNDQRVTLKINSVVHHVGVKELKTTSAIVEIASVPVEVSLDIGEDAKVDVDNDEVYDVYVKLDSITNSKADLTLKYIQEEIPSDNVGGVETTGEVVNEETEEKPEERDSGMIVVWVIIAVLAVLVIVWGVRKKRR